MVLLANPGALPKRMDLRQFFSTRYIVIPEFQRGYSWGKKQHEDLWNDINGLIDRNNVHYFGSIMVIPDSRPDIPQMGGAADHKGWDIIDGQQRMTTAVLLIRAIKEKMQTIDRRHPNIDVITKLIHSNPLGPLPQGGFGFSVNNDRPEFNDCVQSLQEHGAYPENNATTGATKRMREAYTWWRNKLRDDIAEIPRDVDKLARMDTILDCFIDRFEIIMIDLHAQMEAPLVFEVMNNRGLDLSTLDLLKNMVMLIDKRRENDYQQRNVNAANNCNNAPCADCVAAAAGAGVAPGANGAPPHQDPYPPLAFEPVWFNVLQILDSYKLTSRADEKSLLGVYWTIFREGGNKSDAEAYDRIREYFWPLTEALDPDKDSELRRFIKGFEEFTYAFCEYYTRSDKFGKFESRFPIPPQNAPDPLADQREQGKQCLQDIRSMDNEAPLKAFIISVLIKARDLPDIVQILKNAEKCLFRVYRIRNRNSNFKLNWHGNEAKKIYNADHPMLNLIPHPVGGPAPPPPYYNLPDDDSDAANAAAEAVAVAQAAGGAPPAVAANYPRTMTVKQHALKYLCEFTIGEGGAGLLEIQNRLAGEFASSAYNSDWAAYFLFIYERSINAAVQHSYVDFKGTTNLEHVMPKANDHKYWSNTGYKFLGLTRKGNIPPRFTEIQKRDYIDDIGNLLLSIGKTNQQCYRNHPYSHYNPRKRPRYLNPGNYSDADGDPFIDFMQPARLANRYTEWRYHCLIDRKFRLANWAVQHWKLDCDADVIPDLKDVTRLVWHDAAAGIVDPPHPDYGAPIIAGLVAQQQAEAAALEAALEGQIDLVAPVENGQHEEE